MFLVPIPESWDPAEHGWRPAETAESEPPPEMACFLRGEVGTASCSVLTVMRNPTTQQRVAWFGPSEKDGIAESAPSGVLNTLIGITPADWGPEDRQPQVARQ